MEMLRMADKMRLAAGTEDLQRICLAASFIVSWALCMQSEEVRKRAVESLLDMIDDGHRLFGPRGQLSPHSTRQ